MSSQRMTRLRKEKEKELFQQFQSQQEKMADLLQSQRQQERNTEDDVIARAMQEQNAKKEVISFYPCCMPVLEPFYTESGRREAETVNGT